MRSKDLIIAPILEGVLILIVGVAGWLTHQPLIFTSLGPTAYELVETPERKSARAYNILVGNAIAVLAGFAGLMIAHAWAVPSVSASGVPLLRVWATVIATALTVLGTLLARATQPACLSTTLLISTGVMQTWHDAAAIMAAVLLMVVVGVPLRLWRQQSRMDEQEMLTVAGADTRRGW